VPAPEKSLVRRHWPAHWLGLLAETLTRSYQDSPSRAAMLATLAQLHRK
jgi:hypothetical protein